MEKLIITIPPYLKHLPVSDKGYPIPYFVARVNGKPDFRLLDERKQLFAIDHKLCGICGKKLFKCAYYFISGPKGYANKVSTDPAMHRPCAEYSFRTCPHLFYEKADRRQKGLEDLPPSPDMGMEKPEVYILVKADKFEKFRNPHNDHWLIKYRPISYEIYGYENGTVTKLLLPPQ